eukprot:NODE_650_length_5546_cov_0.463558.p1 type:complete len:528 gc:universal NODE_650_length_5546_cov_0.463558:2746-1163(-)
MTLYSAIYSGVQVFEIRVRNIDIMRRFDDNWVNATQILKVGDIEKPARTKILEREVQTGQHEKVQGGYGKYQGTWVPFERGVQLAKDYQVYHLIKEILEYIPGEYQVQQKRSMSLAAINKSVKRKKPNTVRQITTPNLVLNYSPLMAEKIKITTPTIQLSVPQPKDYRDLLIKSLLESSHGTPPFLLKLPNDLDLQMALDAQGHSALHWAAALARVDIVNHLLRVSKRRSAGSLVHHLNVFGQTPLMRAIMYADNFEEKRFPELLEVFKDSIFNIDLMNRTVLHHIALVSADEGKQAACSYYLKCILDMDLQGKDKLVDYVDVDGLTALQIAFIKKNNALAKTLMNSGAKPPISTVHHPADPNSLTYLENLNSSYSEKLTISLREAKELKSRLDQLQSYANDHMSRYERMKVLSKDLAKIKENEMNLKSTLKKLKVEMFDLDIKNYVKKHPNLEIPSDNPDLKRYSTNYVLSKTDSKKLIEMEKELPELKKYVKKQTFPASMLDEWVDSVSESHKDELGRQGKNLLI